MEQSQGSSNNKTLNDMSKEELVIKCKNLLNLAKKAKAAKDEHAEENRKLKETLAQSQRENENDKKMILTLNEMVEEFTQNKLNMTTEMTEMKKVQKKDNEMLLELKIENESLHRQISRLTDDNETLLKDISVMENQLHQVNCLGKEQKKHLSLLELEVNKLKEAESINKTLQTDITELKTNYNQAINDYEQLKSKYQSVKEINAEQRNKFNSLKERFIEIYRKLNKIKESKRILLETHNEYSEAISNWQKEIINASQQLCTNITSLKRENYMLKNQLEAKVNVGGTIGETKISELYASKLLERITIMNEYCAKACEERDIDKSNLRVLQEENDKMRIQIEILETATKDDINSTDTQDCLVSQKLKQDTKNYEKENQAMLSILKIKDRKITELEEQLHQLNESKMNFDALQESLESKKIEIADLNKIIDHLEEVINSGTKTSLPPDEVIDEVINLRDKVEILTKKLEDSQLDLQAKERENSDLLNEMKELNEELKVRGDVISRQEEKQNELLTEIKQTTLALTRIENELRIKDAIIQEKEIKINSLGKEINSIRIELSRLQFVCQENERQIANLANDNEKIINVDSQFEKQNEEKNDNNLKDTESEQIIQQQKQTIVALEEQILELEADRKSIRNDHEQCSKLIDTLKLEISKLKSSRKQKNVLNLEIEAFEKSLNETSAKLNAKTIELETLNESLQSKENTIVNLRKEITILESAKEAECSHSIELKSQIDRLQLQIKDLVHSKQDLSTKVKDLEQGKETLQNELNDVRLHLANQIKSWDSEKLNMQSDKEISLRKIAVLEEQNELIQNSLQVTEKCLEDLRNEYSDYKVKAQAVLRKNQSSESYKERELEEELTAMRTEQDQAAIKIADCLEKIKNKEKQIEILQEDNENLCRRYKELEDSIIELRQQNEKLNQENRHQIELYQETLKKHRVKIESHDIFHKQQLKDIEIQHLREIEKIKNSHSQPQEMSVPLPVRLPTHIGGPAALPKNVPTHPDQNKIDLILMEREAAEGSEETDFHGATSIHRKSSSSVVSRSSHGFMPLDELLNTPMNLTNETIIPHSDFDSDLKNIPPNAELQTTKERLQIQHLTALLAENEQDLCKLTQLNEMLKEEVRRYERTVEREKHMQNSEYVKNIIIKFLTLSNVDERTRLVPVLNTILKLNKNESEMLIAVAKGQKVAATDSNRNWSSFLSSWGG